MEQRALLDLQVFVDWFDLDDVAAVLVGEEPLTAVLGLAEHSMLERGGSRLRMYSMVSAFVAEQGEPTALAMHRHQTRFARMGSHEALRRLHGPEAPDATTAYREALPDLERVARSDSPMAWRAAYGAAMFCLRADWPARGTALVTAVLDGGLPWEGEVWLRIARALAAHRLLTLDELLIDLAWLQEQPISSPIQRALVVVIHATLWPDDHTRYPPVLTAAIGVCEATPHMEPYTCRLMARLGFQTLYAGKIREAGACFDRALTVARKHGLRRQEALVRSALAITEWRTGQPMLAAMGWREALALNGGLVPGGGALARRLLARWHHEVMGDVETAEALLDQAARLVTDAGVPNLLIGIDDVRLRLLLLECRFGDVLAVAPRTLEAMRSMNDTDGIASVLTSLGLALLGSGLRGQARTSLNQALELGKDADSMARTHLALATLEEVHGDTAAALAGCQQALDQLQPGADPMIRCATWIRRASISRELPDEPVARARAHQLAAALDLKERSPLRRALRRLDNRVQIASDLLAAPED
jgi:tetratricopeptide (TPR) repeat protein